MSDQPQAPWVNPYPHRDHVDIVQPNGAHEWIDVQDRLAAEVIKHAYQQGVQEDRN